MQRKTLIHEITKSVRKIEPGSQIILYGSRSRGDARPESDWDLLILVDGPIDDARIDRIRHCLYEIEWKSGHVLTSIVRSRGEWNSERYQNMPFYQQVQRDGVML
ncbi:MAG: nucleotidyltransferase domain-containing protein [candidate division KSB1 bacterium]|nr:nucleotidyltransferase domain-containing protein [candidate division KSB1 bacterium]